MKVDEMIESIEVVQGGHVTQLTVSDGERTEKYCLPFDSTPPSLVVVSREGLVKLLSERLTPPQQPLTFDQLKERVGKPVWRKQINEKAGEWVVFTGVRETHEGGEALQEISYTPSYADDYVLFNPSLVDYYDHEVQ